MTEIKLYRMHEAAVIPQRAAPDSVCFNVVAANMQESPVSVSCGSGWAMQFPEGVWAELRAEPDIWSRGLVFCNGVLVLDNSYKGEVWTHFYKVCPAVLYGPGSVFAQLIFHNTKPEEIIFNVFEIQA